MSSPLTRADVQRTAALAKLEVSEADLDLFVVQLGQILDYAGMVQRIDTQDVAPMSHAGDPAIESAERPDEPRPSLNRDETLAAAPDADVRNGLFRVPKVL